MSSRRENKKARAAADRAEGINALRQIGARSPNAARLLDVLLLALALGAAVWTAYVFSTYSAVAAVFLLMISYVGCLIVAAGLVALVRVIAIGGMSAPARCRFRFRCRGPRLT